MKYKYDLSNDCPGSTLGLSDFDLYYRLIRGNIPEQDDFIPHYFIKKYSEKDWGKSRCSSQGISLFGPSKDRRPRKILKYATPTEVFFGKLFEVDVALQG